MAKKNNDLMEQKFDVRTAAQRLGVSVKTVYRLVELKTLEHYRIGGGRGRIVVSESHLNAYLSKHEVAATA